jgi:hypothetical protein
LVSRLFFLKKAGVANSADGFQAAPREYDVVVDYKSCISDVLKELLQSKYGRICMATSIDGESNRYTYILKI